MPAHCTKEVVSCFVGSRGWRRLPNNGPCGRVRDELSGGVKTKDASQRSHDRCSLESIKSAPMCASASLGVSKAVS
jgi:hypothetical protein